MADKDKPLFTHEQDLGPGVVRTPGYEVEEAPALSGISDRRVDKDGKPSDHPILSTYDGPQNGLTEKAPKPVVDKGDTVKEANAAVAKS
jgi:hypothetical protein